MNIKLVNFLALIAYSEGTATHSLTKHNGYDVLVTSVDGPSVFTDFTKHPFEGKQAFVINNKGLVSTAAGRYQILRRIYLYYKDKLNLLNFSPDSQDKIAAQLISEQRAGELIEADQIELAIYKCAGIWASFPGNHYNQNPQKLATLIDYYNSLKT